MEILIRLAGVQLGPYSEQQVQQHLDEGLLSLKDSAKFADSDDWMPLGELVAKPPASPENAPDAASETPPPIAEEVPETPRRAPSTPPGVTVLPPGHPDFSHELALGDINSQARRTALLGPTPPPRTAGVGQVAPSTARTSPLVPPNQGTKKVSRDALIKALAQTTAPLPTKAIQGLPHPPPHGVVAQAVRPDPKKAPPPSSLTKSLTAKTVPMRSTPAAPPLPASLPITAPLPTRVGFKPAADAGAPPSAAIRALTKRLSLMVHPDAGPTVPPTPEVEVPTEKLVLPIKPLEPEEPKVEAKTESRETRKFPRKPPISVPIEPPEASSTPIEEPVPATPPRRLMPKILWAWGALALFVLYYVWSPYHASSSLRYALDAGSSSELNARIDFPAIRASLKDQIRGPVFQALHHDRNSVGNPEVTALAMLNHSIDVYVTPEGISALVNKSDAFAGEDQSQLVSPEVAQKILAAFNNEPVQSEGLASVADFVSNRVEAMLHLRFEGLGWKLRRIDLAPDLFLRSTPGATVPLIAPVVDTYLERGLAKSKNGDAKGALADLTQVLMIDPQSSMTYNDRGTIRQAKGDLDGAIADYTQALTFDPQMAAAHEGRGNARAAKNDLVGAIADYTEAVRIDPTMAVAYDSRGNAKTAKNDLDGAIADFTQAISIEPSLASAFSDRGFARQANGNADGAIADYTQALALKPNTARTYFNRGVARQTQGNTDAAIVDFDHALAFDPKIAEAYFYRGNAKSTNHDLDGAIADFSQALSLNPKLAAAYGNRGLARQNKGDLEGASADYTQALALDPKIASAYFNRALIEAQKDDLDSAIADSTQALYLDPKNAQAYYTRGFAKLTKGNLDGAQTDLKAFSDLVPRDHNADHARLYLWLIAKAQNGSTDADQELSSALESSWNSPADDLITKTAAFFLNRLNEADYLAGAASADAKIDQAQHCEAWYFAGMKRLLMGDKKGAIDAFQQCLATGQKYYCEYILAQAELQVLGSAPPPVPVAAPVKPPTAPIKSP